MSECVSECVSLSLCVQVCSSQHEAGVWNQNRVCSTEDGRGQCVQALFVNPYCV